MKPSLNPSPKLPILGALLVTLAAAAALPAQASGTVEISYVQPEHFADIGWGSFERDRNLRSLSEVLTKLGNKLPDNQVLRLEVLDVDLAGRVWPGSLHELRVMRGGADWPQMTLRYSLLEDGKTVKAGESRMTDMNYLFARQPTTSLEGNLPYEKRMIDHWFSDTFVKAAR
jgi:hypothetical protein